MSTEISREEIETNINSEIANNTKIITTILNKTITNVLRKFISRIAREIEETTGYDTPLNLLSTNMAVSNVIQDTKSRDELINILNAEVINKIQNDETLYKTIESTAKLQKSIETAGAMADMVALVKKKLDEVLIGLIRCTPEFITIIKYNIIDTKHSSLNQNMIKGLVEYNIKNSIMNITNVSCNIISANFKNINDNAIKCMLESNLDFESCKINYPETNNDLKETNIYRLNTCILESKQIVDLATTITSASNNVLNEIDKPHIPDIYNAKEIQDSQKSVVTNNILFTKIGAIICLVCCLIITIIIILLIFKS